MSYIRRLYFSPSGRVGRFAYCAYLVAPLVLVGTVAGFFSAPDPAASLRVLLVLLAVTAWPGIVFSIKRLHDLGLSGWWLLALWAATIAAALAHLVLARGRINPISLVGGLLLIIVPGNKSANKYGAPP